MQQIPISLLHLPTITLHHSLLLRLSSYHSSLPCSSPTSLPLGSSIYYAPSLPFVPHGDIKMPSWLVKSKNLNEIKEVWVKLKKSGNVIEWLTSRSNLRNLSDSQPLLDFHTQPTWSEVFLLYMDCAMLPSPFLLELFSNTFQKVSWWYQKSPQSISIRNSLCPSARWSVHYIEKGIVTLLVLATGHNVIDSIVYDLRETPQVVASMMYFPSWCFISCCTRI